MIFYEKIKDLNKAKYLELIEKIVESDKLFLIPQDLGNSIVDKILLRLGSFPNRFEINNAKELH